jgi:expansin (peptidoglycan-binding protein)
MRTAVSTPIAGVTRNRRFIAPLIWFAILATLFCTIAPASAQTVGDPPPPQQGDVVPVANQNVYLPLIVRSGLQPIAGLPFNPLAIRKGEGTYYDADGSGNCSFDESPGDLMVGAMNESDYANAWLCGAYVQISGPKGSVLVRIVDRCPECKPGDIDLSREAFAKIADMVAGRVPISWRLVSPTLSGPIRYRFKEGSSKWWTAVQIRNHRTPIWRVEYRTASGVFKEAPRERYNYFIESAGMGDGPYTFRVTDIFGQTLTDTGIALVVGGEVAGKGQFPPIP